jgi:hypothetical protein
VTAEAKTSTPPPTASLFAHLAPAYVDQTILPTKPVQLIGEAKPSSGRSLSPQAQGGNHYNNQDNKISQGDTTLNNSQSPSNSVGNQPHLTEDLKVPSYRRAAYGDPKNYSLQNPQPFEKKGGIRSAPQFIRYDMDDLADLMENKRNVTSRGTLFETQPLVSKSGQVDRLRIEREYSITYNPSPHYPKGVYALNMGVYFGNKRGTLKLLNNPLSPKDIEVAGFLASEKFDELGIGQHVMMPLQSLAVRLEKDLLLSPTDDQAALFYEKMGFKDLIKNKDAYMKWGSQVK